jgi:hypothetical protein
MQSPALLHKQLRLAVDAFPTLHQSEALAMFGAMLAKHTAHAAEIADAYPGGRDDVAALVAAGAAFEVDSAEKAGSVVYPNGVPLPGGPPDEAVRDALIGVTLPETEAEIDKVRAQLTFQARGAVRRCCALAAGGARSSARCGTTHLSGTSASPRQGQPLSLRQGVGGSCVVEHSVWSGWVRNKAWKLASARAQWASAMQALAAAGIKKAKRSTARLRMAVINDDRKLGKPKKARKVRTVTNVHLMHMFDDDDGGGGGGGGGDAIDKA